MTKTEIIKTVVGSMAAIGSGAIAAAYISNAPYAKNLKPLMKACVWVGGLAIEGVISDRVTQHTDKVIDQAVNTINGIKEAKDEISINITLEPRKEETDDQTAEESV